MGQHVDATWAGEAERMFVVGGSDGASVNVQMESAEVPDMLLLDLATGAPLDAEAWPGGDIAELEPPSLPVGLAPAHFSRSMFRSVRRGDQAAAVVRPILNPDFGAVALRVVVSAEDGVWQPVEGCPPPISAVFATPDQLWTASWQDGTITWAPILGP